MKESTEEYLSEHIRDTLIHDSRVNEQDLVVEVKERRITLGGNVSTMQLHETITRVAEELLPDYEIINQTRVVPAAEPDGEETVP